MVDKAVDRAWKLMGDSLPDWIRERRLEPVMQTLRSHPFHCHLIKYDPQQGISHYDDGTWTSISDVGEPFRGVVLTMDDYLAVEQAHLDAVRSMAIESGSSRFRVGIDRVSTLSLDELLEQIRLSLRGESQDYWWNAADLDFYVVVGWDFQMYVGSHVECVEGVAFARNAGLHPRLDEGPSPYLYR